MLSKETITFLIRYLIPYGRQPYRFHCKYRAEGERSRTKNYSLPGYFDMWYSSKYAINLDIFGQYINT